jgi:sugar phosphate permease
MSAKAHATAAELDCAPVDGSVHDPTLRFVRRAAPALGAGLLLSFSSSFGQTFFLSLFGGVWREEFDLSHGAFGALYAVATLLSAACLLAVGKTVDHVPPSRIALILLVLTALAALWLSSAENVLALGAGLFAMRVLGQGLLSHLAITTVAKWFDAARGRALGIAMLGFPIGEAMLPVAAASAMATFGWRAAWLGVAAFVAFALAPAIVLLAARAAHPTDRKAARARRDELPSWTRRDALHDWRFYALAPGILAAPFLVTSVLFHHAYLVETKGWTLGAFSTLFILYAASSTAASLVCGRMVDAVGTRRVLPFFLTPLAIGLACVSLTDAFYAGALLMALMGATAGAATIVCTSVWSELYGTDHLGAIRAVAVSAMVLSSALGPALAGAALDAGFSVDMLLRAISAGAVACAIYLALLQTHLHRQTLPNNSKKDYS